MKLHERRINGVYSASERITAGVAERGIKLGRKSHAEERPDVVALARALARKKPKGGQLSLRAISAELAVQGFLNERGQPFHHKSVAAMLAGR